jgi:hypothetical protein
MPLGNRNIITACNHQGITGSKTEFKTHLARTVYTAHPSHGSARQLSHQLELAPHDTQNPHSEAWILQPQLCCLYSLSNNRQFTWPFRSTISLQTAKPSLPRKYINKAVPETGCEGPYGCEALSLAQLGLQIVVLLSALRTSHPLPQEDSWYSPLLPAELTLGP